MMKFIYSLYSSMAESLVYYTSKRKALQALKAEYCFMELLAKRRGAYTFEFSDDSTAFTIHVGNEKLSASITKEIVH